jgi:hypothetical protein
MITASKNLGSRELLAESLSINHVSLYFKIISYIEPARRSVLAHNVAWRASAYIHKSAINNFESKLQVKKSFYYNVASRLKHPQQILDPPKNRNPIKENHYEYLNELFATQDGSELEFSEIASIILSFGGNKLRDLCIIKEELKSEYDSITELLFINTNQFTPPPHNNTRVLFINVWRKLYDIKSVCKLVPAAFRWAFGAIFTTFLFLSQLSKPKFRQYLSRRLSPLLFFSNRQSF